MKTDFKLNNDGAGLPKDSAYQEAHKHFKKPTPSACLRQRIWAALGEHKDRKFTLPELISSLYHFREERNAVRGMVYQCCRHLALKGLIRRTETLVDAPTKKDPSKQKAVISVQYVEPWTEKTEKKW